MKTQPRPSDREPAGGAGRAGRLPERRERLLRHSVQTAAHRSLPFGTLVNVCHDGCVTVRINDRGPFARGRDIHLSPAAARAINLHQTGICKCLGDTQTAVPRGSADVPAQRR